MRTTKATKGCCRKKKLKLHNRLRKSCIAKSSIKTQVVDMRRLHTSPADTPIRIYNTPHTSAKTYPGGVNDDFSSIGYQVTIDLLCKSEETYPTSNEMKMNFSEENKVLIRKI